MTTTNSTTATHGKVSKEQMQAAPRPETGAKRTRRLGREMGTLVVNAYERGVADVVAFEQDAAKITPYPWAKSVLTLSAGLVGDVGAAYVKTARTALR